MTTRRDRITPLLPPDPDDRPGVWLLVRPYGIEVFATEASYRAAVARLTSEPTNKPEFTR